MGDGASRPGLRWDCRCCSPRQTGGGEAVTGARVRGEDTGGLSHGDELPGYEVDVERSGAPYVAPPRGEHMRAAPILGGKEGDDLTEDGVGQEADVVDELFCFFQPPLHHSGDHSHGGMTVSPPVAGIRE